MSHYYEASGKPRYTLTGANGKVRDTTLRDARKLGLYPSVTEVKKAILVESFLEGWLKEQVAKWSFANQPSSDETEEEYVSRAIYGANHVSRKACDFGNMFHNTAEEYAKDRSIKIPFEVYPFWGPFKEWFDENVLEVVETELATTCVEFGIGGSIDLICVLKDVGLAIVDFKTQGVAVKTYKTEPLQRKVATWYPGWIQQLGLYAAMYEVYCQDKLGSSDVANNMYAKLAAVDLSRGMWHDAAPKCVSVVIDSREAGFVQSKLWTDEERNEGLQLGLSCCKTWQIAKKYKPEGSIL